MFQLFFLLVPFSTTFAHKYKMPHTLFIVTPFYPFPSLGILVLLVNFSVYVLFFFSYFSEAELFFLHNYNPLIKVKVHHNLAHKIQMPSVGLRSSVEALREQNLPTETLQWARFRKASNCNFIY